jgi:tetratricopeptide (TPR) repeat protein
VQSGDVIAERFVLAERIGAGAIGVVYRARDLAGGAGPQSVAVKLLRDADAGHDPRFVREAAILARLDHPAIVRHLGHGRTLDGDTYLAMEWLEGETLSQRLAHGALTPREAVRLVSRIAEALGYAHRQRVVHRDVKPANVFLPGGDPQRAKLIDFGIARHGELGTAITSPGMLIGTPGYMAPEQARGELDVDARVDVFALGCVLYRCLAGAAPFEARDALATLAKVVLQEPAPLEERARGAPKELVAIVQRMLAKDRAQRFANGDEVVAALAALELDAHPGYADGVATSSRSVRPPSGELLTDAQQQVVSIVLAGARGPSADEPTWVHGSEVDPDLADAMRPFGARVDWLMDGTCLAVFQKQGNAADQAALAARCALSVRRLTNAPIVLETGRSVLTRGTLVGEVIDRAFERLHERRAAAPTTLGVWLDEVTSGLLPAEFLVERARPDEGGPVLTGTLGLLEPPRTLLHRPTPCVGRKRELAMLEGLFDECIAEPAARAALVTAEAGLGKSRLRHEHLRHVTRLAGVEVWIARGDPMSAGAPLTVIAQMVRRACGIREGESPGARREKLAARVARHVPAEARARVAAFLGELVGATDDHAVGGANELLRLARHDAMLMSDQLRRAWLDLLGAETRAHPVVLVIEDLHWGDPPSVEFLDATLRLLADAPLMVLALARPEVHDLFPRLWSERPLLELRLRPLAKRACRELVHAVLGEGFDEAAATRIIALSAGNAFYLEELIRAVSEGRGDALPETVLAMVQARLDALEPDARRLLRAGSIFGQTFPRNGVLSLIGADDGTLDLDRWLDVLGERELLTRRGEGRFADEEYTFRHAILRDGAYAMLTDADRALGHRLASTWLEEAGERDAMLLAEHAERGGDQARARALYTRAAQQALAASDLAGACARAERGIACGATGEALGELWLVQAEVHRWRGEWQRVRESAAAALALLPPGGAAWSTAAGELALASGIAADDGVVREIAEQLRTIDTPPDARAARCVALGRTIGMTVLRGMSQLAPPLLAHFEALFDELPRDAFVEGWRERARGMVALRAYDVAGWARMTATAVALFDEAGDIRAACAQRVRLGDSLKELGAYEEAERLLRDTLELAVPMGLSSVTSGATQLLGLVLARRGDARAGRPLLEKAVAFSRAHGDARQEGNSRVYLAQTLLSLGELGLAEAEARAALVALRDTPPLLPSAHATLACVLLAAGRPTEALAAAADALAVMEGLDWIEEGETFVLLAHAEALEQCCAHDAALAAFARARARVDEQASRIHDEATRQTFLSRVAENVRILQRTS